jgi:hypothetical protein
MQLGKANGKLKAFTKAMQEITDAIKESADNIPYTESEMEDESDDDARSDGDVTPPPFPHHNDMSDIFCTSQSINGILLR